MIFLSIFYLSKYTIYFLPFWVHQLFSISLGTRSIIYLSKQSVLVSLWDQDLLIMRKLSNERTIISYKYIYFIVWRVCNVWLTTQFHKSLYNNICNFYNTILITQINITKQWRFFFIIYTFIFVLFIFMVFK